jgi:hypothetical protein
MVFANNFLECIFLKFMFDFSLGIPKYCRRNEFFLGKSKVEDRLTPSEKRNLSGKASLPILRN